MTSIYQEFSQKKCKLENGKNMAYQLMIYLLRMVFSYLILVDGLLLLIPKGKLTNGLRTLVLIIIFRLLSLRSLISLKH